MKGDLAGTKFNAFKAFSKGHRRAWLRRECALGGGVVPGAVHQYVPVRNAFSGDDEVCKQPRKKQWYIASGVKTYSAARYVKEQFKFAFAQSKARSILYGGRIFCELDFNRRFQRDP